MTINRLSKLFSAISYAPQGDNTNKMANQRREMASVSSSDAVTIGNGFGARNLSLVSNKDDESAMRQQRVAMIKEQVAKGEYRVETNALAEAVAKELLV